MGIVDVGCPDFPHPPGKLGSLGKSGMHPAYICRLNIFHYYTTSQIIFKVRILNRVCPNIWEHTGGAGAPRRRCPDFLLLPGKLGGAGNSGTHPSQGSVPNFGNRQGRAGPPPESPQPKVSRFPTPAQQAERRWEIWDAPPSQPILESIKLGCKYYWSPDLKMLDSL